jgi:hypothetical protein
MRKLIYRGMWLSGRGVVLPGLVAFVLAPAVVQAQNPLSGGNGQPPASGSNIGDKQVMVDADNQRLVDVLPALMKQVGADYSLDADIQQVTVSLHLPNAKFQAALDTLMKVATQPVTYKIEDGLYHFMRREDAPASSPSGPSSTPSGPGRSGPPYRGDDQIGVALSDLVQYLSGADNRRQGRSLLAGSGSFSGSKNFSQYGFVNGHFTSSSYSDPDTGNPNASPHTSGSGFNFGPLSSRTSSTTRSN